MKTLYFTYGLDNNLYPFSGGWTEVIAPDYTKAIEAFKERHPNKKPNILNCVDYYTEEQFGYMRTNGNFGRKCHEVIFAESVQDDTLVRYTFLSGGAEQTCILPKKGQLLDYFADADEICWACACGRSLDLIGVMSKVPVEMPCSLP